MSDFPRMTRSERLVEALKERRILLKRAGWQHPLITLYDLIGKIPPGHNESILRYFRGTHSIEDFGAIKPLSPTMVEIGGIVLEYQKISPHEEYIRVVK